MKTTTIADAKTGSLFLIKQAITELYQTEATYLVGLIELKMFLEKKNQSKDFIKAIDNYLTLVIPKLEKLLDSDTEQVEINNNKPYLLDLIVSYALNSNKIKMLNMPTVNENIKSSKWINIIKKNDNLRFIDDNNLKKAQQAKLQEEAKLQEQAKLIKINLKTCIDDKISNQKTDENIVNMFRNTVHFFEDKVFYDSTMSLVDNLLKHEKTEATTSSATDIQHDFNQKIKEDLTITIMQRTTRYEMLGNIIKNYVKKNKEENKNAEDNISKDADKLSSIGNRLASDYQVALDLSIISDKKIIDKLLAPFKKEEEKNHYHDFFTEAKFLIGEHLKTGPSQELHSDNMQRIHAFLKKYPKQEIPQQNSKNSATASNPSHSAQYKGTSVNLKKLNQTISRKIIAYFSSIFFPNSKAKEKIKAEEKNHKKMNETIKIVHQIYNIRQLVHPTKESLDQQKSDNPQKAIKLQSNNLPTQKYEPETSSEDQKCLFNQFLSLSKIRLELKSRLETNPELIEEIKNKINKIDDLMKETDGIIKEINNFKKNISDKALYEKTQDLISRNKMTQISFDTSQIIAYKRQSTKVVPTGYKPKI